MLNYIRDHFHPLWRLRRFAWFRRLQAWIDFPVSYQEGKIKVSLFWLRNFGHLIADRSAEKRMKHCFKAILAGYQPNCFWDIGASIGDYSWRVANWSDTIDIWMFEPDVQNIKLLGRTIDRNRLGRISLYPVAVSDRNGTLEFMVDPISGATGSILDHTSNSWSLHSTYGLSVKRPVTCIDLDSLQEKLGSRRLLIKIDVEGTEDQVLRGARRILREARPVIFLECFGLARIEWLRELDYDFLDLKEGGNFVVYPREMQKRIENEWLMGLA
ncbi:MAG: FkbM family methyltransferase [Methylacidiphilales bacterium]|nr:FkbM family methyltransferase [Candidatus Methylacidiphilales bacterium]